MLTLNLVYLDLDCDLLAFFPSAFQLAPGANDCNTEYYSLCYLRVLVILISTFFSKMENRGNASSSPADLTLHDISAQLEKFRESRVLYYPFTYTCTSFIIHKTAELTCFKLFSN